MKLSRYSLLATAGSNAYDGLVAVCFLVCGLWVPFCYAFVLKLRLLRVVQSVVYSTLDKPPVDDICVCQEYTYWVEGAQKHLRTYDLRWWNL